MFNNSVILRKTSQPWQKTTARAKLRQARSLTALSLTDVLVYDRIRQPVNLTPVPRPLDCLIIVAAFSGPEELKAVPGREVGPPSSG
jgi:hypothetical protein